MTPMVRQISLFAFNFAPLNWMTCDGSLIPISENDVLFQLLGFKFGGDGDMFGIPNLTSAAPLNLHFCISLFGQYKPRYHEGFIGETMLGAFALAATNLMPATGQLLPKSQYPLLNNYMGTRFGGDAQSLALPNLQNQSAGC